MLPVSVEINESDAGQEEKNLRPIATCATDPSPARSDPATQRAPAPPTGVN